jgi:hypothetical protein
MPVRQEHLFDTQHQQFRSLHQEVEPIRHLQIAHISAFLLSQVVAAVQVQERQTVVLKPPVVQPLSVQSLAWLVVMLAQRALTVGLVVLVVS